MNHIQKHMQKNTAHSPVGSENSYYQCPECTSSIHFRVGNNSQYARILEHILEHKLEKEAKA